MPQSRVLTGQLLDFTGDPRLVGDAAARHETDGALVVGGDGRIAWRGARTDLPEAWRELPREDQGDRLILPGFIDPHVHFPQVRMLAAPGRDLLDWLTRFTFAEEARYADRSHGVAYAAQFLDRLIANGTTTAVAYGSSHKVSAEVLFEAAARRGMAIDAGKVMMDDNAPAAVRDTAQGGYEDSAALIADWHGRGRARYAITLRFAVTSSEAQMEACGALVAAHPGCVFQTHLSESPGEIAEVARRFPWARDYTDVYDRFGLLTGRGLFAHGIHLSERECARLGEAGAAVVHCPTSNTFLGSGLFDIDHLRDPRRPVAVGLATDVGGGTSYSMQATMGEAHKVAMLKGRVFDPLDAFHTATRGNARMIGRDREIGTLEPGSAADLVVVDPCATPVLAARHALSESLRDMLFALMLLGDDRVVAATYVGGKRFDPGEPVA